jgi:hypothetical protein
MGPELWRESYCGELAGIIKSFFWENKGSFYNNPP